MPNEIDVLAGICLPLPCLGASVLVSAQLSYSPSMLGRLWALRRRRRDEQGAGVPGDYQILVGGDHPYHASAPHRGDDIRMHRVPLGAKVNPQVRQAPADLPAHRGGVLADATAPVKTRGRGREHRRQRPDVLAELVAKQLYRLGRVRLALCCSSKVCMSGLMPDTPSSGLPGSPGVRPDARHSPWRA